MSPSEPGPGIPPGISYAADGPVQALDAIARNLSGVTWNPVTKTFFAVQDSDRRHGRVRFDLIHEGPPGCVHGGHVAWFFDQSFGQIVVDTQIGGPTHHLEVTYRRPTPILRDLDYELVIDRVEGRKIFASAKLRDGDVVVAEASALFVEPKERFATRLAEAAEAKSGE